MTPLVIAAAMLVTGIALLAYGLWTGRRGNASQQWDCVPGELVSHEIIEVRGRYGTRNYSLRVAYRYSVDGREYEGRRLCFGVYVWEGLSEVQLWLDQNARQLEVFYDPKKPASAVLMPGRAGAAGTVLFVIIGVLLTAMGLVFTYANASF